MARSRVCAFVLCLTAFLALMPGLSALACLAVCLGGAEAGRAMDEVASSGQFDPAATEEGGPLCPASPDTCKSCTQCAADSVVMHLPVSAALSLRPHVFSSVLVSSEAVDRIFVAEIFQPPRA